MSGETQPTNVEMVTWYDATSYINPGETGDGLIVGPDPRVEVGDSLYTSDQEHVLVTRVLDRNPTCQMLVVLEHDVYDPTCTFHSTPGLVWGDCPVCHGETS